MLSDEQKDVILLKLMSTPEGRSKIIKVAKDAGAISKLGRAIDDCFSNFCKPLKK